MRLSCLESCPVHQKCVGSILVRPRAWVLGSIPGRSAYKRQPINVSLMHPCFTLLKDKKKKKKTNKQTTVPRWLDLQSSQVQMAHRATPAVGESRSADPDSSAQLRPRQEACAWCVWPSTEHPLWVERDAQNSQRSVRPELMDT